MTKPDWSKAPEWADSFGLLGIDKHDAWVSLKLMKYQYLKGGKVYQFGTKGTFYLEDLHLCESRPTQWRGPEDGLPPVGTVCEYLVGESLWEEVTVVHRGRCSWRDCAVIQGANSITVEHFPSSFRPIKTQEQRELEQLQDDIDEAFQANAKLPHGALSEFLHAKGWRKP